VLAGIQLAGVSEGDFAAEDTRAAFTIATSSALGVPPTSVGIVAVTSSQRRRLAQEQVRQPERAQQQPRVLAQLQQQAQARRLGQQQQHPHRQRLQ
jgi:hypothetical protein